MKFERSLLRRLVTSQLSVVIFFCLLAAGNFYWQTYKTGEGEVDMQIAMTTKILSATLEQNKSSPALLKQNAAFIDSMMQVAIKYCLEGRTDNPNAILAAIRITSADGSEIYRSSRFAELLFASAPVDSREFTFNDREWRGSRHTNADRSITAQLVVSSTPLTDGTYDVIGKYILLPLLVFLPLAALMVWFFTINGLSPLRKFAEMIAGRTPNDMRPLERITPYTEITPLANAINSLLQKLETTLNRERNFLADAAHELRTPLAVVQAQVHVLKHAKTEVEKNIASAELNIGISRAASLIQKLLLTARVSVDDFTPRFEATNLTAFVQERIALFSVLAASKSIDLELEAPTIYRAYIDRETFASAIDNVIDNAIRYTPPSGAIRVEIASCDNDKVRLRVIDNGQGIPPELHERVFERFFRVAGTEQQGSGLGLAIVRRVLSLHRGDVTLSSGLDKRGLSVELTLPTMA